MATKTKVPSMQAIAAEMRQMIVESGARWVHRRLSRGLELVLQRTGREWRLALGRYDTWPSEGELMVCRVAFGVPVGFEENREMRERGRTKLALPMRIYVVELLWQEESHE